MKVAAIVLAAGFSRRMQQFKPLLPLGGETITDRLIHTFLQNGIEVVVVTGYRQDELRAGIKTQNVRMVENPDYLRGMFTSVQTGLRHLNHLNMDYEAVFIAPVDIPLLRPFTIRRLLAAAEEHPGKLVYPVFNKKRGHPPLIPVNIYPAISGWQSNSNLKSILRGYENMAIEVKVPDSNILFDIDSPVDYEMLLERFQRYEVPIKEECEVIIKDICQVAPHIYRHCSKVAEVAAVIGQALIMAGTNLDLDAIRAAALLHDIAKGQPDHDIAGAMLLREMGFGKVADMVAVHTDLPQRIQSISMETKVVYLSDKFVVDEMLVSLEERYQSAVQRFGVGADIEAGILQRRDRALAVKKEIELLLGQPLEKILFKKPGEFPD